MPLLHTKEIITPLKLIGIKVFRCTKGNTYIKVWKRPRKKLFS
ncbi:hypothetical protein ACIQXV_26220 [Neobacillus sp. NPDC097160]